MGRSEALGDVVVGMDYYPFDDESFTAEEGCCVVAIIICIYVMEIIIIRVQIDLAELNGVDGGDESIA